ncbi:MAG TPA: hypothetical protein VE866_10290 [Candidatus Binatia bacterium]|nr:hypothetical protein [Candidatus Binatia bacterium]
MPARLFKDVSKKMRLKCVEVAANSGAVQRRKSIHSDVVTCVLIPDECCGDRPSSRTKLFD